MYHVPLEEIVERTRSLGDTLVEYNYPLGSEEDEGDLSALKTVETTVDGYPVVLHYNKADYNDHFLETLQIFGRKTPFLPFSMVTKIARRFLGGSMLYLAELLQNDRKVYIWTICVDKEGHPIENPRQTESEELTFQGFEYRLLSPSNLHLY